AQAGVDEAFGQVQQEVAFDRSAGALDVEAVVDDAVEDGLADGLVVVGLWGHVQRPATEGLATAAARLVLGVVDIEEGHLAAGQGADTTAQAAFAAGAVAAVRGRGVFWLGAA